MIDQSESSLAAHFILLVRSYNPAHTIVFNNICDLLQENLSLEFVTGKTQIILLSYKDKLE